MTGLFNTFTSLGKFSLYKVASQIGSTGMVGSDSVASFACSTPAANWSPILELTLLRSIWLQLMPKWRPHGDYNLVKPDITGLVQMWRFTRYTHQNVTGNIFQYNDTTSGYFFASAYLKIATAQLDENPNILCRVLTAILDIPITEPADVTKYRALDA